MTNLYKVTCAKVSVGSERTFDVYVLADDEAAAGRDAIDAMKGADYAYTDYVKRVELVASSNKYKAPSWLVEALSTGELERLAANESTLLRAIEAACHAWNQTPADERTGRFQELINRLSSAHQEVMRNAPKSA